MKKIQVTTLNEQQKAAVFSELKPTLVVAGAGSGKTTVIIRRYEYLIKECNFDPSEILVVTFTQKAIREIKTRVQKLFENDPIKNFCISTFHKFCINLIVEEIGEFNVCFDSRCVGFVKEAIDRVESTLKAFTNIKRIIVKLRWIERAENRAFDENDLIKVATRIDPRLSPEKILAKYSVEEIRKIYKEFLNILAENKSLYFDDMLFKAEELLNNEEIRSKWGTKIKAILFDEFQDIDPIQFRIIAKLAQESQNIFCVGDPDQSIYGFRDALRESFKEFQNKFQNVQIFKLEQNYRSTPEILAVANKLINKETNDFSKILVTNNPSGEKVKYFLTDNPEMEAEHILRIIQKLHEEYGVEFKKFAILFRNWSYSKKINNLFLSKNIPFLSQDLRKLLQKTEVKDLFACLIIAFERKNITRMNNALLRVINKPARGFGKKRKDELVLLAKEKNVELIQYIVSKLNYDQSCRALGSTIKAIKDIAIDEGQPIKSRVTEILKVFGLWQYWKKYPDRFETIKSFLKAVFDENVPDYKSALRRVKAITQFAIDKDKIFLTTIHGAKGLEFEHVFVLSLNEGFLPSKYSLRELAADPSSSAMDEERRLFYVALTRAQKGLYLFSYNNGEQGVSRFVKDIEDELEKVDTSVGTPFEAENDFEEDGIDEDEDFERDALTDIEEDFEEDEDDLDEEW